MAEQTGNAVTTPSPSLAAIDTVSKPSISPTVKTTIAPIHTKEPIIKPPVDQPSVVPSYTPSPELTQIHPTTPSQEPTSTPEERASVSPGDNQSASTYFQWGRAYEDAGDYTSAIEEYDRAIAREPYYSDAWYHKALCFENLGMWDDAYQAYRFLLTIDPGYPAEMNLSNKSINNSTDYHLPPGTGPDEGTPLLWVASGAAIAGIIAAGLLLYHRRRISWNGELGNGRLQTRTLSSVQAPYPDIEQILADVSPYYTGDEEVFRAVIRLSIEIAREGREGKPVGTSFILGDSDAVMQRSRQLILNPLAGHSEEDRLITSPDMRENIKELALVDGAFVIRENGIVEAAGRYISIDTSKVRLPKGFGTRHVSVAAITQETEAIGIVVSESGGLVRVFARGNVIVETM
ncbi:MAG: diadenylate cyclase [Methanobacteriota archaeon]